MGGDGEEDGEEGGVWGGVEIEGLRPSPYFKYPFSPFHVKKHITHKNAKIHPNT